MSVDEAGQEKKGSSLGFLAFVPFGTLLIHVFYRSMPLKWVSLASLLNSVSLFSIYENITRNDILWSVFGVWAFLTVCTPVYLNIVKTSNPSCVKKQPAKQSAKITFTNLFWMGSKSVFSDYRTSLLAKIPLVIQVQAAGSILYQVFGVDWIMHALAGFGIGAAVMKAYDTVVDHYGYSNLASYFRLDRFQTFRVERKTSSAEFTLFSLVVAALTWELLERVAYFASPANLLRIGAEPLWNMVGDIIFDIVGGLTAWFLISYKLKWK